MGKEYEEYDDDVTTEATEKMMIFDTGKKFDMLLDIVKFNTDLELGE